jgi:hypothetical protein
LNDSDKEKNISMDAGKGKVSIIINPLQIESRLLIKSDTKPSSVKLNNENLKFEWNDVKGQIQTSLNKGTKAQIEILYK